MTRRYFEMTHQLHHGDCLEIMPSIESASVDAIIIDPPYPYIKRDYGYWTEETWIPMMQEVVRQSRRILKPRGSMVIILQPNSEKVGKMRLWLWRFMVWCGEEWNIVQDVYWWNFAVLPEGHAIQGKLTRPSLKSCVWLGVTDCYRNQEAVLWDESQRNAAVRLSARATRQEKPSGHGVTELTCTSAALRRGGVTPFNVLPIPNTNSITSAGAFGHGAGTPLKLCDWWTRYICPPGGVVADWFAGTGTTGLAALQNGCSYIGVERMEQYAQVAQKRLEEKERELSGAVDDLPIFAGAQANGQAF